MAFHLLCSLYVVLPPNGGSHAKRKTSRAVGRDRWAGHAAVQDEDRTRADERYDPCPCRHPFRPRFGGAVSCFAVATEPIRRLDTKRPFSCRLLHRNGGSGGRYGHRRTWPARRTSARRGGSSLSLHKNATTDRPDWNRGAGIVPATRYGPNFRRTTAGRESRGARSALVIASGGAAAASVAIAGAHAGCRYAGMKAGLGTTNGISFNAAGKEFHTWLPGRAKAAES